MITNPQHPIAQKLLRRLQEEFGKDIPASRSEADLYVCPAFENALCIRIAEDATTIYEIERNSRQILRTKSLDSTAKEAIHLILAKKSDHIADQLDGTIVFGKLEGNDPEFIYIKTDDVLPELRRIVDLAELKFDWADE